MPIEALLRQGCFRHEREGRDKDTASQKTVHEQVLRFGIRNTPCVAGYSSISWRRIGSGSRPNHRPAGSSSLHAAGATGFDRRGVGQGACPDSGFTISADRGYCWRFIDRIRGRCRSTEDAASDQPGTQTPSIVIPAIIRIAAVVAAVIGIAPSIDRIPAAIIAGRTYTVSPIATISETGPETRANTTSTSRGNHPSEPKRHHLGSRRRRTPRELHPYRPEERSSPDRLQNPPAPRKPPPPKPPPKPPPPIRAPPPPGRRLVGLRLRRVSEERSSPERP